jgi:hypothetical protein
MAEQQRISLQLTDTQKEAVRRACREDADTYCTILLHAAGALEVRQKALPLMIELEFVGNAPVEEKFSRGQFLDLTESEKLSAPSFEPFKAGVDANGLVELTIAVEQEAVRKLVDNSKQQDVKVEHLVRFILKRICSANEET